MRTTTDGPALLAAALAVDPVQPLRLDGLTVHRGDGAPAAPQAVQLAAGRFVAPEGEARRIDLGGWTLLPGLCDAHLHLFHEARRRLRVDLAGLARRAELWERLAAAPADGPVIAVGWDESDWDDPRFPTRAELDALFPGRPAGLIRVCGHAAVANSAALALLEPPRDSADGLLLEGDAVALARRFPLERERLLVAAADVARDLAAEGLTAVTDMGAAELPALAGALPADFPLALEYFHAGPLSDLPAPREDAAGRPLGRKFFLDGSIGGRTAAVDPPYADGGSGTLLHERAALERALAAALEAGWSVALHAIGERALGQALDCLESLRPAPGSARLEHVEMLAPGQVERAGALGVAVCMQPNFMDRWGRPGGLYARALGPDYARRFSAPGDWRRGGVPLAYGTDGMPAALWPALRASVDASIFGEGRDRPETALAAVTGDAARAAGRAAQRGQVKPGLQADFCLVERDPCAEDFKEKLEVALTARRGRLTWLAPRHQGR